MPYLFLALLVAGLTWRIISSGRLVYTKRQLLISWMGLLLALPVTMAFWQGGMDLSKAARQSLLVTVILLPLGLLAAVLDEFFPSPIDLCSDLILFIPALWYATQVTRGAHRTGGRDRLPPL